MCIRDRSTCRVLAKPYVFHYFSAGLPEMILIFNEIQQFLCKPDFFNFAPLRSHYVSYGLAHTPICGCQTWYILLSFFGNFTFCEHATFEILALTIGFGNFFVLHRILGSSSRPVAINHCHVLPIFARKPHVFLMLSFEHCWTSFCFTCNIGKGPLSTWCASRRSCSKFFAVRNVWRALIRDQKSLLLRMLKICYVFHHFLRRSARKPKFFKRISTIFN